MGGPPGDEGPVGGPGEQGQAGDPGEAGVPGRDGARGSKGDRGNVGAQGIAGPSGPEGPMGLTGKVGPAGDKGDRGSQGMKGHRGLVGAKGPQGNGGNTGKQGRAGEIGAPGPRGDPGPPGPPGRDGAPGMGPFPLASNFKGQGDEAQVENFLPTETLKLIKKQIDNLDNKDSKSNARTCTDLYIKAKNNGQILTSDNYFIDRNSGSEADSFEVYCDFNSEEEIRTCIYPNNSSVDNINKSAESLTYLPESSLDESQLNFLKVNYKYATQTINFNCNDARDSFTLYNDEEVEFNLVHTDVNIFENNCNQGGNLKLEVSSRSRNMPITDVTSDSEDFGYELEPVCFYG